MRSALEKSGVRWVVQNKNLHAGFENRLGHYAFLSHATLTRPPPGTPAFVPHSPSLLLPTPAAVESARLLARAVSAATFPAPSSAPTPDPPRELGKSLPQLHKLVRPDGAHATPPRSDEAPLPSIVRRSLTAASHLLKLPFNLLAGPSTHTPAATGAPPPAAARPPIAPSEPNEGGEGPPTRAKESGVEGGRAGGGYCLHGTLFDREDVVFKRSGSVPARVGLNDRANTGSFTL